MPMLVPSTDRRVHHRNCYGTPRQIRPHIAWNLESELGRYVTALVAARWVADRREAERRLLYALSEHAKEMRGEWARLELTTAQTALATL